MIIDDQALKVLAALPASHVQHFQQAM